MAKRPSKVARRRQILEAARRVFARSGYAGTPMSAIAAAAKVGKGTLYEHFKSKEDLFAQLLVSVMRESMETMGGGALPDDPETALRGVIAYVVSSALDENVDLYRLFYDFWGVAAYRREGRSRLREISTEFQDFVASLVRRGQQEGRFRAEADPAGIGLVLCAAVDGLSLQIVMLGRTIDLKDFTRLLQDLIVGGLTNPVPLDGASVLKEQE